MTFNWKANEELTCECEPEMTDLFGAFPFNDHLASLLHPAAGTNGYPIPNPNPKYFSIPDPYPINFQNHRVFRVSGIREKPGF